MEQARADRTGADAGGRDVYELLDLGFGRCTMVVATVAGPDPAAEALRRLGVIRVATKYPRVAAAHFEAHRPPGRDRRGQGLGRAGAADGAGRGDRRPHRDRHDAAREQPRGPRGDRRLHGAADRQPGRAQAEGGGDRRPAGALRGGLSAGRRRERRTVARRGAASDEDRAAGPHEVARLGAARRRRAHARAGPDGASVEQAVREIIAACARGRRGGARYTARFDTAGADDRAGARSLTVSPRSSTPRSGELPLELVAGLEVAIANVAEVA